DAIAVRGRQSHRDSGRTFSSAQGERSGDSKGPAQERSGRIGAKYPGRIRRRGDAIADQRDVCRRPLQRSGMKTRVEIDQEVTEKKRFFPNPGEKTRADQAARRKSFARR